MSVTDRQNVLDGAQGCEDGRGVPAVNGFVDRNDFPTRFDMPVTENTSVGQTSSSLGSNVKSILVREGRASGIKNASRPSTGPESASPLKVIISVSSEGRTMMGDCVASGIRSQW